MPIAFDIFCTVVDNFGDIGVTWRLARQLQNEGFGPVRLWVDDLESFARICPGIDATQELQQQQGILIQHWHNDADLEPARVVIEAFACELPAAYKARMQAMTPPPAWLNLEYLSAEEWVEGCHPLPSPQGQLNTYFFFPGFTAKTGGLICEQNLLSERMAWQAD
ncbi:MAG: elongation factor P maturation arginine rhamnosyltransferase EarP, partial [Aeromonas sp.]